MSRDLLDDVAHRPLPLPPGPWLISQSWRDVLFAHWAVKPGIVRDLLPAGLEADVLEGAAWVSIVALQVTDMRVRNLPALPGAGRFAQVNVRTYVRAGGDPGVYFFSADVGSRIAAKAAGAAYRLPFKAAALKATARADGWIDFRGHRHDDKSAEISMRYRGAGPVLPAGPGSVDHWLTERYVMYAAGKDGGLYRGEIHHRPWLLQEGTAEIEVESMSRSAGFGLEPVPSLLHFAAAQDVVIWPPDDMSG